MKKILDALDNEVKVGDLVITILKKRGGQKTLGLAEVVAETKGNTWSLKPCMSGAELTLAYNRITKNHMITLIRPEGDIKPVNNPDYVGELK